MKKAFLIGLAIILISSSVSCIRKMKEKTYHMLAHAMCLKFASEYLAKEKPVFVFSKETDKKLLGLIKEGKTKAGAKKSHEKKKDIEKDFLIAEIELIKKANPEYSKICDKLGKTFLKCYEHESKEEQQKCYRLETEPVIQEIEAYLVRNKIKPPPKS